jgi:hypothetical protein
VKQGIEEMIQAPHAHSKVLPVLRKLLTPLRQALLSKGNPLSFAGAVECVIQLSNLVGPELNPLLAMLLPSIGQKIFDKQHATLILECLEVLEKNGGKDALVIIKAKIPTYTSIVNSC